MSKRDIKAKRWGRKSAKRQMAVEPVIVDGFPRGPQLRFLTQYRKFGDGREQLRGQGVLRVVVVRRKRGWNQGTMDGMARHGATRTDRRAGTQGGLNGD